MHSYTWIINKFSGFSLVKNKNKSLIQFNHSYSKLSGFQDKTVVSCKEEIN